MKLYRNLAEVIVKILAEVLEENKRSSRVIEREITKNKQWGSRDRKTIRKATYDILRWKNQYEFLGASPSNYWSYLNIWVEKKKWQLPDWEEFKALDLRYFPLNSTDLEKNSLRNSIPLWLEERGSQQLGHLWDKECAALNTPASVILRANRILIAPQKLQKLLQDVYRIETKKIPYHSDALALNGPYNLMNNPLFKKGYFEFQDANSQAIGPFCEVEPGMKILDACAGAGGKTLHLAALMRNKGEIVACDIHQGKLTELKKRVKRAKVKNVNPFLLDENEPQENKPLWADRVLIDAPCSGIGTLKRNPELKWNLKAEQLEKLIQTQREILLKNSAAVRPGGKLIYVTCSILPEENRQQIDWFLDQSVGKAFALEDEKVLFAHQTGFDGFYAARLVRKL